MKIEIPKHIDKLVERYHALPSDQQLILVTKAHSGDHEAKDLLVLSNLRFVLREIRALPTIPIRLEFADLFNAGVQGMLEALENFDSSKNVNFLTYAYWWIKKRIIQTVYSNLSIIHIPKAQVKQLEKLHALCEKRLQRMMSHGEELSASYSAIEMAQELFEGNDPLTFDRLRCAWNAFDITDSHTDNYGSIHLSSEDQHHKEIGFLDELEHCMCCLTNREEDIIKRHFGIGCRAHTNEEIGLYYAISTERIRQLLKGAMEKVREELLATYGSEELM